MRKTLSSIVLYHEDTLLSTFWLCLCQYSVKSDKLWRGETTRIIEVDRGRKEGANIFDFCPTTLQFVAGEIIVRYPGDENSEI